MMSRKQNRIFFYLKHQFVCQSFIIIAGIVLTQCGKTSQTAAPSTQRGTDWSLAVTGGAAVLQL